jgi:hypothetical protein
MFASAQYNHWEDDDYKYRYLSDLFWDDMLDTAPWMRERREACPSWAAEPACRRTLSERGAGAAGLGRRGWCPMSERCARRAARSAAGLWGAGAEDGGETVLVHLETGSHMHLIPCLSGTCVLRVPGRQVER